MDVLTAIEREHAQSTRTQWSATKRIAFRFCFVYLGLYCVAALLPGGLPIPKVEIPDPFTLWPFRQRPHHVLHRFADGHRDLGRA